MWKEIRNNFYDEREKCINIDAWKTNDSNEEGTIIAKIFPETQKVVYLNKKAKTDAYAQDVISKTLKNLNSSIIK